VTIADRAWAFISAEVSAGRPLPSNKAIAVALGRDPKKHHLEYAMQILAQRGWVRRTYRRGFGPYLGWTLSPLGRFLIDHPDGYPSRTPSGAPEEPAAAAGSSGKRKPRRTGAPTRVPHKPTTSHKKPSRRQRRETERRREHQVTS
jgi:hypothetical protein